MTQRSLRHILGLSALLVLATVGFRPAQHFALTNPTSVGVTQVTINHTVYSVVGTSGATSPRAQGSRFTIQTAAPHAAQITLNGVTYRVD